MNLNLQEFIRNNSIPEPNSGCWLWLGRLTDKSYAIAMVNGKLVKVSRLSLHAFTGFNLNSKLMALHKCNNKPCVNFEHLRPGTAWENVQDCIKAGTFSIRHNFGSKHYNTKKTHCPKGHAYIGKNVFQDKVGSRRCLECCLIYQRIHRAKKRLKKGNE